MGGPELGYSGAHAQTLHPVWWSGLLGVWSAGPSTERVVMSASVVSVISRFLEEYLSSTPQRLKLLDAYLLYILLTGALQFGYCLLVGTFPFNSFLSGFISCVGSFILAGSLFDFPWRRALEMAACWTHGCSSDLHLLPPLIWCAGGEPREVPWLPCQNNFVLSIC
uniref:Dolichyl-diphosphooligosaccharide--protein glycosyltransferase subunit DAD1 n=1 Tax=Equus asinus TaxID=9793 RepID=A0A9L0JKD1_EQUAS